VSAERPEPADLERQAAEVIEGYRSYLDSPAFQHQVDLHVLVKIAGDENQPIRERRRAAEVLARLRLEAMDALADLTGTREQALEVLGIKQGPSSVALTQVNQKIEIVRAKDWRSAVPLEEGEVIDARALPDGIPEDVAADPPPALEDDHDDDDDADSSP
jgi:hypothetical protein